LSTHLNLAWLYWDPQRVALTIPYFDIAIMWYGILFALGFIVAYLIFLPMIKKEMDKSRKFLFPETTTTRALSIAYTDRLVWFIVIGTIIGARLGHVFFYDWPYYQAHPVEIIMIRNGGLASHGGAIGVILAICLFYRWNHKKYPSIPFLTLLDLIAVPTALTACFIRLANFVNQEIVGTESTLPWAIIFGHPAETATVVPRHPAQLYEAAAYLATFAILYTLWLKYSSRLKPGMLCGLFFILIFTSRFFIEFIKMPQSMHSNESFLQTGQYLSIPFIILGIVMMLLPKKPL